MATGLSLMADGGCDSQAGALRAAWHDPWTEEKAADVLGTYTGTRLLPSGGSPVGFVAFIDYTLPETNSAIIPEADPEVAVLAVTPWWPKASSKNNPDDAGDPLALDSPALAQIGGASVLGRVATGPRAGRRVLRLGADPKAAVLTTGGPRHAHSAGFDLHANVAVRAGERLRLEHRCRYVLRPPLAQEALEWTADGKVLLRLRRPWRDGARAICFEPAELLERLAAMVPRPRTNLLIYHGAFAPRGCQRVAAALAANSAERLPAQTAPGDDGVTASVASEAGASGVPPSG